MRWYLRATTSRSEGATRRVPVLRPECECDDRTEPDDGCCENCGGAIPREGETPRKTSEPPV